MSKQTKTVRVKGYVTYETGVYADKNQPFSFQTFKPSKKIFPELVLVNEAIIEIQVPVNFDPRPEMIKTLRAQQTQVAADFQALTTSIMRQISELQALEMS